MENRPAGFSGHDRETLRREALTYLANLPRLLNEQGTQAAGQTALSLGNYLNWIHGLIEAGPNVDQPLHETPTSLYALAKQLQAIGRRLLSADKMPALEARIERLENAWGVLPLRNADKDRIFEQSL